MQINSQISLFEEEESNQIQARWQRIYQLWLDMPNEIFIADGTAERQGVLGKYGYMTDLWFITNQIIHICYDMPLDMYCWLNTCEPAEYWVLNQEGNPGGEHIETCPYCSSRLIDGRGDVVVLKDQRRHFMFPKDYNDKMQAVRKREIS